MGDDSQAAESSSAASLQQYNGPTERSSYADNPNLNLAAVELYQLKQKVYVKGERGVDPKPYKIYKMLGDGQYWLSRDGKSDKKVYNSEDLQTVP